MSEQASAFLVDRIGRQQSITTEKALAKLAQEAREPISAGSKVADAKAWGEGLRRGGEGSSECTAAPGYFCYN